MMKKLFLVMLLATSLLITTANGYATIEPEFGPIDPYLATPAKNSINEIPIVIMRFLPTTDDIYLDVAKSPDFWELGEITLEELKQKIDTYDKWIKYSLEEGSRFRGYNNPASPPSLGYKVIEYITVYEQVPPGDTHSIWFGYGIDYHSIFDRFNMEHYVNVLGVKEVWIWTGLLQPGWPSYDPNMHKDENYRWAYESNMSSPTTGDISNSFREEDDLPIYNSTYTVYTYNFRRTHAEAVHNHGHQIESILWHANKLQDGNSYLFWNKFVGYEGVYEEYGNFITGRSGCTHRPPNFTKDYDYLNTTPVLSDIEDWTPDNIGTQKLVSANTWGSILYDWPVDSGEIIPQKTESQWYIYWMQNMPGNCNAINYGENHISNWWVFTADWDSAITSEMGLYGIDDFCDKCPTDPNKTEPGICGCGNPETDSDNDGLSDCIDTDDDNDGLSDADEDIHYTDPYDPDTDNDGLYDGLEVHSTLTDPLLADSDNDGIPDDDEDSDSDGFTNFKEVKCGSDPGDPNSRCSIGLPWLMLLLDESQNQLTCNNSTLNLCSTSNACTNAGGYWWSDNTCLGVAESETVVSADGRIWMDRNLGASRVAQSVDDVLAFGYLYQWGRGADGHQLRTSLTTTTLSTTNNPGHGDFITSSIDPYDWRNPQNDNLWQSVSGNNNPCPGGFRLPTYTEWGIESSSWSSQNSAGAFSSPLKLVVSGHRYRGDGNVLDAGKDGSYWAGTVFNTGSLSINLYNDQIAHYENPRGNGLSIRCIMD